MNLDKTHARKFLILLGDILKKVRRLQFLIELSFYLRMFAL